MWSYLLFIFILASAACLGWLVYRNDRKSRDNRLFLYLIILIILWMISSYFENEPFSLPMRNIFLRLDFALALIMGYFWLIFCYSFLENKKLPKIINRILLGVVFFVALCAFSGSLVNDIRINNENGAIAFNNGPLFILYIIVMIFNYIGGLIWLFRKYKDFTGKKKIQVLYVLIGFLVSIVVSLSINLFAQNHLSVELFRLGNYVFLFWIFFTTYSIIRHQLFDIKVVIQRGLVYSIVFSTVIAFYLFLLCIFNFFMQGEAEKSMLSAVVTMITGIYGVPVIERYFRKKTDRIFFKDKYDYTQAIYNISEILNRNLNRETLLGRIAAELEKNLKPQSLNIILPEQNLIYSDKKMIEKMREKLSPRLIRAIAETGAPVLFLSDLVRRLDGLAGDPERADEHAALGQARYFGDMHRIEMVVPIRSGSRLIGLVTLSRKLSGDEYSAEDLNLLGTFACQAAVALENAQLYEKVKEHSRDLEKRVAERTAHIKNLQEEQRQMMLEIAHGLQTPLTIIKGELGLLMNRIGDKTEIRHLENTIDHVSHFIYDMLRLSRQEKNFGDVKKEAIDLSEIVEEAVENIKVITEGKEIDIASAIEPNIGLAGDRREIEELIMNLASNGLKYLFPKKRGKIIFDLYRKNDRIVLSVADNGIGIGAEHLPHIFEKLYRVKDAAHTDKSGTGLGLAISKKIVEKHGGTIRAESEPGQGAKFIINFPAGRTL